MTLCGERVTGLRPIPKWQGTTEPTYRCRARPISGGALEAAQDMANHSDPRTTKLYDRRKDLATLSEIERRITFE